MTINLDGSPKDIDFFFFNNNGEGEYFSGVPVCNYCGKNIPTVIRWNESATVTSNILVNMLKTLDFFMSFLGIEKGDLFY